MMIRRVLLTGGGGMVGQNLLEHPGASQFDILSPRRDELDLRKFEEVCAYLDYHRPDLIIHAAGRVGGIQANISNPSAFLLDNLDMGRNIVCAARNVGIRRLINLGSSCMYPKGHSEPLREDMILKGELEPTNEGYALAKIAVARLCEYITREDNTYQYKTIIPCNLYGRYDKFNPSCSHLVPAVIHKIYMACKNHEDKVVIWGDGKARREFMYAGDFADALLQAMKKFDTLPGYMNIGLGFDYSIDEYYQTVADVIGYKGQFIYDSSKPVGMARKLVCIDRQLAWGWKAKFDLRSGIRETYEYYLQEMEENGKI